MRVLDRGPGGALAAGSVVVLAAAATVGLTPLARSVESCSAINVTAGGVGSADLQGVIDAAVAGDRIEVEGVCIGNYTIDKTLNIVGHATMATPMATLDGNGSGRVLSISVPTDNAESPVVKLRDLLVTNGVGGIEDRGGRLTLAGSTRVTQNTGVGSFEGGGIYVRLGSITLNGSSQVSHNSADHGGGLYLQRLGSATLNGSAQVSHNSGGGIYLRGRGTVSLNGSSQVSGNSEGGIGARTGAVSMNDSSQVSRNTASEGAGISLTGRAPLTMNDKAIIRGNAALNGAGIWAGTGLVTLNDASTVRGNVAKRDGGGIVLWSGRITLNDSATVSQNRAELGGGGGIYRDWHWGASELPRITLNDSSAVRANASDFGGGLAVGGLNVALNDSATVSHNRARFGGGLYARRMTTREWYDHTRVVLNGASTVRFNNASRVGGGVNISRGSTLVLNHTSRITRNTAAINGGGIYRIISVKGSFDFTIPPL